MKPFYPLLLASALLTACAGSPPPPDWKMNAQGALASYQKHYLNGDSTLANLNFARANTEISRTARLDLAARAELFHCATRLSALEIDDCPGYVAMQASATEADQHYARFLTGDWRNLDPQILPPPYVGLLGAQNEPSRNTALAGITDPISRLIAAGALFRRGELSPDGLRLAVDTASEQGWRRPLLAYLSIQAKRAEAAADLPARQAVQRRIDLINGSRPATN